MYCMECGTKNVDQAKYCVKCGSILNSIGNEIPETETWICLKCGKENKQNSQSKYVNICSRCAADRPAMDGVASQNNIKTREKGCYRHPERQAVAQCPNCGAFMCRDCYNRYEGHMCKNCTYENNKAYISRIRTSLIWAAVFFVLGWIIGGAAVGSGGFLIGLWAAGLPGGFVFSGWDVFATMDMGCLGMVFYWIFRLLAASAVGLILTIINIFRLVRAISVQRELEDMDIWD